MIYVVDNFLPKNLYKELLNYSDEFKKVEYPDVSFWVKTLPEEFSKYIKGRLEKIEGKKIKNILCFLREFISSNSFITKHPVLFVHSL